MTTESMVKNSGMEVYGCCPECGWDRTVTDYDRGEKVCARCGCIIENNLLDFRPEQSYEGKDRVHNGASVNPMLHDGGLTTEISRTGRDGNGHRLDSKAMAKYRKLSKIQKYNRMSNAFEKGLATALGEIKKLCSAMSLPENIQNETAMLYRKAMRKGLIRGRSISIISTVCVYISCRMNNIPRTLKEMSSYSRINSTELGRTYRFLFRSLKIKVNSTKPKDYIPRFCTNLNLSAETQRKASKIIDLYEEKGLDSGKGPIGIAAAAIYIATIVCNERRTQRSISEASNVTGVTIRHRSNEMMELLGLE